MARELAESILSLAEGLKQPRQRGRFWTEAPPRPTQEPKGRIDVSNEGGGLIGTCPSIPCLSSPTSFMGMLKKAASSVLGLRTDTVALLPCSRLRVRSARHAYSAEVSYEGRKGLRPFLRLCSGQGWTDFFEHSLPLMRAVFPGASMGMDLKYSTDPLSRIQVFFLSFRP